MQEKKGILLIYYCFDFHGRRYFGIMKTMIKSLPELLLILLYVYTVTAKLIDAERFRGQLYNQSFPHYWADILLFALPVLELTTVGLLISKARKAGLWLSLGLLGVFTGYIILVKLHFWSRVPCSCGGVISKFTWTQHLIFNIFFLILNLIAIRQEKREKPKTFEKSRQQLFI